MKMKREKTAADFFSLPAILMAALMIVVFTGLYPAYAQEPAIRVFSKLPGAPEGVCIDSKKNLYASMPHLSEVVLLNNDGSYEHVAYVPSKEEVGQGEVFGMDVDKDDNLYVAYLQFSRYAKKEKDLMDPRHPACRDARVTRSGVYRIDAGTRKVTPVATRAEGWPFCFPDDIAIDKSGHIYLTDLTYSGVWKISPDGKTVKMWNDHPLLNWSEPTVPQGANALVFDREKKNLYVCTTNFDGQIIKLRISEAGDPAGTIMYSRGHTWFDGIEMDEDGNLYASEPGANQIVVIPARWYYPKRIIISSPLFQGPTSLVIRDGILYAANYGYGLPKDAKNKTIVAIRVKDFLPAKK